MVGGVWVGEDKDWDGRKDRIKEIKGGEERLDAERAADTRRLPGTTQFCNGQVMRPFPCASAGDRMGARWTKARFPNLPGSSVRRLECIWDPDVPSLRSGQEFGDHPARWSFVRFLVDDLCSSFMRSLRLSPDSLRPRHSSQLHNIHLMRSAVERIP